jgi:hypothetical protein
MREAGFGQVMLAARDIVGHPAAWRAAVAAVQASGLRVTGFQVLRDFEGLSGHLHDYKVDIAKQHAADVRRAGQQGAAGLLVDQPPTPAPTRRTSRGTCASWRCWRCRWASAWPIEGLSWGRTINEFTTALGRGQPRRLPNLGIGIDSSTSSPPGHSAGGLDELDPSKIFLVQLSDFMWQETARSRSA